MRSSYARRTTKDIDTIVGCDLLAPLSGLAAASNGSATFRVPCNPLFWSNTRISNEIRCYNTFRPLQITLHWQPAVGTTTAGAVAMGSLCADSICPGASFMNALLASRGGTIGAVWEPQNCQMDLSGLTQRAYYVNGIDGDSIPVVAYIVVPTALANAGYLWVSYTFDCMMPCAIPTELAQYSLTPSNITLTDGSSALVTVPPPFFAIGYMGVLACNGSVNGTYFLYREAAKTNIVFDMGQVGSRYRYATQATTADINVYEGTLALFGAGGLVTSVFYARDTGSL